VIWVILEDGRLGMIHDLQGVSYRSRYVATSFAAPDLPGVARALGAEGVRAARPGELVPAVDRALDSGRPTLIAVRVDASEVPPMKPRMLALERSLGLPDVGASLSWRSVKALLEMARER